MFSGKVGKITRALQFREMICKFVLEHISSCTEDGFLVISISRKHIHLIKAGEAWGIFSSSACSPSSIRSGRGTFITWGFRQRRCPGW